jgi:hypothetical protein
VGEGENQRVYQAIARDLSAGGLRLKNVDIPETETRFRLKFRIPTGTMPEEDPHGHFKMEGAEAYRTPEGTQIGVAFKENLDQTLGARIWRNFRIFHCPLFLCR